MADEVIVTQEDREAAAIWLFSVKAESWVVRNVEEAKMDDTYIVQAFARHRIAAEAPLRAEIEDRDLFIRGMLECGSYWRTNTQEFCHRGVCYSLKVVNGIPQLTDRLRDQLRQALTEGGDNE